MWEQLVFDIFDEEEFSKGIEIEESSVSTLFEWEHLGNGKN